MSRERLHTIKGVMVATMGTRRLNTIASRSAATRCKALGADDREVSDATWCAPRRRFARSQTSTGCRRHGNGRRSAVALEAEVVSGLSTPIRTYHPGCGDRGHVGYLIEQELGNVLPAREAAETLLTMIEATQRRGGANPTKSSGRLSSRRRGLGGVASKHGWTFRRTETKWRRVVPSPQPPAHPSRSDQW